MNSRITHCYQIIQTRCIQPAVSLTPSRSPLLGMAVRADGMGETAIYISRDGFFLQLGIPFPHVAGIWIAVLEFCGGILLGIGLASRPIALLLGLDMIAAYLLADRTALASFFSDPGEFYGAAPFTFLAASLLILIFGPGRFALDPLIAGYRASRETEVPIATPR